MGAREGGSGISTKSKQNWYVSRDCTKHTSGMQILQAVAPEPHDISPRLFFLLDASQRLEERLEAKSIRY